MKTSIFKIFLTSIAVTILPLSVFADTGGYVYPTKKCQAGEESIKCDQWFQKPDLCKGYLNDPQYYISEGSVGASVQHYIFCKRLKTSSQDIPESQKTRPLQQSTVFGIVGSILVVLGILLLLRLRKKH